MSGSVFFVVISTLFTLGHCQVNPIVKLEVISPRETFGIPQVKENYVFALRGQPIILDCNVDNMPPKSLVFWNFFPRGSNNVIPVSMNLNSYDDSKWKVEAGVGKGNSYRLTLLTPTVKSQGNYECSVEYHDYAPMVKAAKYMEIIAKPTISASRSSTDIQAKPGDNVDLQCFAEGIPTPSITWRRAGKSYLPSGGEFHTSPTMTIKDIQPEHQGEYICEAKNKAGSDKLMIRIKLKFPPRIKAKNVVYQKIGYKKDLICDINANPIPRRDQVTWSKDGRSIFTKGRYKVGYTNGLFNVESYLSIRGVQPEDYGEYTCMASTESGSRSATISLKESDEPTKDKTGRIIEGSPAAIPTVSTLLFSLCLLLVAPFLY